jgi:hypothetical protein
MVRERNRVQHTVQTTDTWTDPFAITVTDVRCGQLPVRYTQSFYRQHVGDFP